jgi:hypothetical protein
MCMYYFVELLHASRRTDRRTDMTKLIVAFRNFAKSAKKKSAPEKL